MTAVTKFFFRSPATETTAWSIVQWWESRRVAYNLAVGAAGIVTVGVTTLFMLLPPHPIPSFFPPWQIVALYGVGANICYTAGPMIDVAICRSWGEQYSAVGPALFRYGFAFSIGLTLLPIPISVALWAGRLLSAFM